LIIYCLGTLVPEREIDAVWYHLGTPLYYIQHGGFIQLVPFNMPSHYPMYVHLHYTVSLIFGNETTAKVFIFLHFIPFSILIWSVVKQYSSAKWGMFAVATYLTCMHFRLPVMANVQRAVYFYVFLSTVILWLSLDKKSQKLFLLSCFFCGFAMGTKFNALLYGYIAQGLLMIIWFFLLRKDSFIYGFKQLVTHSIICWIVMSPWLIKSYILTNNPLYPIAG
jgi:hypothetical protein